VDLPEPDGPMMATNSPMPISMSTPRTASTDKPPDRYALARPLVRSSAGTSSGGNSPPGTGMSSIK
jgi:hypothetical protein